MLEAAERLAGRLEPGSQPATRADCRADAGAVEIQTLLTSYKKRSNQRGGGGVP